MPVAEVPFELTTRREREDRKCAVFVGKYLSMQGFSRGQPAEIDGGGQGGAAGGRGRGDLDSEAITMFKKAFSVFDKDGDGTIDTEELGTVLGNLGHRPPPDQLAAIVREAGRNSEKVIWKLDACFVIVCVFTCGH